MILQSKENMAKYNVKYIKSCRKFLDNLEVYNPELYKRFSKMIDDVLENPFKSKFKKLKDSNKDRRNRYGDYRVVYFVEGDTVFVTKIEWRKNVYKNDPGCPKLSKKKLKSIH